MSDPIAFASLSPRFGLPLLYAGQAQKELHVNEAHALIDALLHCAIEGMAVAPPANPAEGTCWLIAPNPTGAWIGKSGKLACWQSGNWLYTAPRDGMRLLDRSTGQDRRFVGTWRIPVRPTLPSSGTMVDAEARAAIAAILTCLESGGMIAPD
jgi:hypothetical protein